MRNPNKLAVADAAMALAVAVYRLTNDFPASERFGLVAQMRRAAVSIGSNIGEGCGRSGNRDFLRFLQIARGSSTELAYQLALSAELGFGGPTDYVVVAEQLDHVQRMLNRLAASVRRQIAAPPKNVRTAVTLREKSRTPHSASRTPHPALRIPHSATATTPTSTPPPLSAASPRS